MPNYKMKMEGIKYDFSREFQFSRTPRFLYSFTLQYDLLANNGISLNQMYLQKWISVHAYRPIHKRRQDRIAVLAYG